MSIDEDVHSFVFTHEDCKTLSQLDSLEFGVIRPPSTESAYRQLLDKAVTYFDSIIAQLVLDVEKDRSAEELEALQEAESRLEYGEDLKTIRHRIHQKHVERLQELIHPKVYLYLGHFNLLLFRFDDALSAYCRYALVAEKEAVDNCAFLYGLGLCSYRFNAFNRTINLFSRILYLQPWFLKGKEIHVRLGYIYKLRKVFDKSLKHFRQALNDSSPATFNRVEIRFHIAQLLETCGKIKQASQEYRQLLDLDKAELPVHIRHLCLRQLAWIHHTTGGSTKADPSSNEKDLTAVKLLKSALDLDSTNGKTWYLLGRCHASLNRVQDAFGAYRSSIDKTEASADTWCSIGVLYQEQSQPMDALQAYFCAVQLDKCHVAAWANLGTLYESMQQYKEAVKCYTNAFNADKRNDVSFCPELRTRLNILQNMLSRIPEKMLSGRDLAVGGNAIGSGVVSAVGCTTGGVGPTGHSPGTPGSTLSTPIMKLPTVDEAWTLPIPAELTQRQIQLLLQETSSSAGEVVDGIETTTANSERRLAGLLLAPTPASILKKRSADSSSAELTADVSAKRTCHPEDQDDHNNTPTPILPLTKQQLQLLRTLQTQEYSLNSSQRQLLSHLQLQALHHRINRKERDSTGQTAEDDDAVESEECPTTDCPEQNAGSSCTRVSDPVDLFPTVVDDDLPAVVGSPGTEQLHEVDFSFFTDDFLAQLNRSETAANLDLVELALFAHSGAGSDQPRPLSNNPNSVDEDKDNRSASVTTPIDRTTDDLGQSIPSGSKSDPIEEREIDANSAHYRDVDPSNNAPGDDITSTGLTESVDESRTSPAGPVDLLAHLTRPLHKPTSLTASLTIDMSSTHILEALHGLGRSGGPWWPGILPEGSPVPSPPPMPFPSPADHKLFPPTPCLYMDGRKDASSSTLLQLCSNRPVLVLRGIANTLRMDLSLFSTKSLVESNPEHRIEVRTQRQQPPDVNVDIRGRVTWFCESPRTVTTIAKFASYQAASFKEAIRQERCSNVVHTPSTTTGHVPVGGNMQHAIPNPDGAAPGDSSLLGHAGGARCLSTDSDAVNEQKFTSPLTGANMEGQKGGSRSNLGSTITPTSGSLLSPGSCTADSNPSCDNPFDPQQQQSQKQTCPTRPKLIRFGTNCDLSEHRKWGAQLQELNKLPSFLRVASPQNMLSHVGYSLLGMNTVQLYMKVPGCRTPGHQENNCFSSVNINIGPGDCEWFVVPEQYWGAILSLCEKNGIDYLSGSWWPNLRTLFEEKIPVYRFIQRPGDLVWINAGSVHWVQAIGWCNNIAWNVGLTTARQYQLAVERYEFNRFSGFKSNVPMIHLSWQLAKNLRVSDANLYELIKQSLLRALIQSKLAMDFLEHMGLVVKRHGKQPDDVAHSCHDCEIEVFNLLFVISQEKKLVVRCLDCARRMDSSLRTFTILAEYYIQELADMYDEFKLHRLPIPAFPIRRP